MNSNYSSNYQNYNDESHNGHATMIEEDQEEMSDMVLYVCCCKRWW